MEKIAQEKQTVTNHHTRLKHLHPINTFLLLSYRHRMQQGHTHVVSKIKMFITILTHTQKETAPQQTNKQTNKQTNTYMFD